MRTIIKAVAITVALTVLSPAAFAATPQTTDLTPTFRGANSAVDRLQVYEISGIVIIRGRAAVPAARRRSKSCSICSKERISISSVPAEPVACFDKKFMSSSSQPDEVVRELPVSDMAVVPFPGLVVVSQHAHVIDTLAELRQQFGDRHSALPLRRKRERRRQ